MSVRYGQANLSQGSLFWHHRPLQSDAKQRSKGQICLSMPNTNDRFYFLHTFFVPTLEIITILPLNTPHTHISHFVLKSFPDALVTFVSDQVT